ncbi:MAG TPA: hydroxyacid dehydrogenase [Chloroflexota bacterium]|nr:hydroxyacid dehydrogenase [Chloroflexota bacterium]
MLKALYILRSDRFELVYGPEERAEIDKLVDVYAPPQSAESVRGNPRILADAEVILSGWGAPVLDAAFLAAAPKLKAFFYGAGSIKAIVTDAFWDRGIVMTSAYAANAVPVAEFTLSQILYSLKRGWYFATTIKCERRWVTKATVPGGYGSTVGLISLGMVGRRVRELLKAFDLAVLAYDPFLTPDMARELDVERCSLEDIFRRADVVSLHTPWLKETEGMITGAHLASMKPNATFINTSRGAIVRESELIEVLQRRPDLWAILDVTYPEPPVPGSPLYLLPNVVLTPHIAGAMDGECRRLGRYTVEELRRYVNGEPLRWAITREREALLA